jgi:threonine dehydrogenase-like Zn-dependent dehydrogenase
MSGGSWGYSFRYVMEAADRLKNSKCKKRKAFGDHLKLIANALHDIEWVDSCDYGPGDEIEAIMKVISKKDVIKVTLDDAKETIKELQFLVKELE